MMMELLEKKCPRCGKASANPSNPSGRCKACLAKLKRAKKTPGSWQRAQTKADDALRRQKGKNGTAHKKHSGLGSRKSIVKQVERAERKTGQKLSPDRKNNNKGYAASNTRMVPEKLNRGRHHVDNKKLRAWQKKKLKKSLTEDELYTYVLAKAEMSGNEELLFQLREMTPSDLETFVQENLDKHAYEGNENNLHGLISPKGEFIPMKYHQSHDIEILRRNGHQPRTSTETIHGKNYEIMAGAPSDKEEAALKQAYKDGWISVGHAGEQNATADHAILSNRTHPASMALRNLVKKNWDLGAAAQIGAINAPTPHGFLDADPHKFVKFGTLKSIDDLVASVDDIDSEELKKANKEYVYRSGARGENSVPFKARCHHCDKTHSFNVDIKTYNKWNEGGGVDALRPYMSSRDIKEIAKDGMCGDCKDKMYVESEAKSDASNNMEKFAKAYVQKYQPLEKSTEASLFKRYEDKYIIPISLKDKLEKTLSKHLSPDYPDKKTKFTDMRSVYFDSTGLDMIQHHLSKSQSRFKIRTREYAPNGNLSKSDFTYLEVKAKHNNISDKFRIKVPNDSITAFMDGKPLICGFRLAKANKHIAVPELVKRVEDINSAMMNFVLRPSCEIMYKRKAFGDGNPDGLRVTFDQNVKFKALTTDTATLTKNDPEIDRMVSGYVPDKHLILEVKHHGNIPDWLTEFLTNNNVAKTSFSKYCYSMGKNLKNTK